MWMAAHLPANEEERLKSLYSLGILDSDIGHIFDPLVQYAQWYFAVPVVMVSLIDAHRIWMLCTAGSLVKELPRECSFCSHALLQDEPLIVENACRNPRFAHNPYVQGSPGIRFYVGHPLVGPDGCRIGNICLIDFQPRSITDRELACLEKVAFLIEEGICSWYHAKQEMVLSML